MPYLDACVMTNRPLDGKYCHYADDPCLYDADCQPDNGMCIPNRDGSGFACGYPACPV